MGSPATATTTTTAATTASAVAAPTAKVSVGTDVAHRCLHGIRLARTLLLLATTLLTTLVLVWATET